MYEYFAQSSTCVWIVILIENGMNGSQNGYFWLDDVLKVCLNVFWLKNISRNEKYIGLKVGVIWPIFIYAD